MLANKLSKLFKSQAGKFIISAVLGLGLASLFRKMCDDYNCRVYRGVEYSEVENKSFQHNDKCYNYTIHPVTCDEKRQIVDFKIKE